VSVLKAYQDALIRKGYQSDPDQLRAVERLERMHDELVVFKAQRSNRIKKLLNRPDVPRGVWLFGGVGRGKSFLMDCFYNAVPVTRKLRIHFHEFMRGVHRELLELKGTQDPLDEAARRIAKRYRLICFDEFHVSDIADAMILERLMRALFGNGATFVMTSNYEPDSLYPGGLHRDRVLPAIEMIKSNVDVLSVDAGVDYRRRTMAMLKIYHTPLSESVTQQLVEAFAKVSEAQAEEPKLRIAGREVRAIKRAGSAVWFDFQTLCGGPRSQNDYLELASRFHTVFVSDIPKMSTAMASEARRFVWLIDVFYDQSIKLVLSAQCPPEELYVQGAMANEFARTVSRINEMQSREYLEAPRRTVTSRLS
jgi:cell division protein ZapE